MNHYVLHLLNIEIIKPKIKKKSTQKIRIQAFLE